jgi:endonuclease YncB( thermonuclease family)
MKLKFKFFIKQYKNNMGCIKSCINSIRFCNLKEVELKDCKKFIPDIRYGKIVKIYDGDTITIGTKIKGIYYKFSVRLPRVDTPELKSKDIIEKQAGELVRDKVYENFMNKIVELKNIDYDKFGRILAEVIILDKNINLSDWILKNNYGTNYLGGTKEKKDWSYLL